MMDLWSRCLEVSGIFCRKKGGIGYPEILEVREDLRNRYFTHHYVKSMNGIDFYEKSNDEIYGMLTRTSASAILQYNFETMTGAEMQEFRAERARAKKRKENMSGLFVE